MTALDTLANVAETGRLALDIGIKALRALTTDSVSPEERKTLRRIMGRELETRVAKVAADAKARAALGGG